MLASCTKNGQDSAIVQTRYTYRNTTNYQIDVNVYRQAVSLIQFNYTIRPHDSLSLDYRDVGQAAAPFGEPEVDSAEVVFDKGRKLIYTLTGENGMGRPRNIFNMKDPAYNMVKNGDGSVNLTYDFTSTDYYNAK